MGAYEALAASYDRLTNDVNYGAIVAFYEEILKKEGLKPRTAVDLACGTGSVSAILAGKGLSVIGVDMSEEMLTAAQQKCADLQNPPRFVRQSLQRLCLPRGVDLAVCALDSLDYITNPEDCKEAIRRVWKALNPGGMFVFDVNTPEKLRAMDGQVFLDEDDDVYCVWRGEFNEETNICSYGMDLFQRSGDVWHRSFEEHCEYAYSRQELEQWLFPRWERQEWRVQHKAKAHCQPRVLRQQVPQAWLRGRWQLVQVRKKRRWEAPRHRPPRRPPMRDICGRCAPYPRR